MPYKHKRRVIRDAAELERLEIEAEKLTAAYMRGDLAREDYVRALEKINLYLDLRQLAVELEAA